MRRYSLPSKNKLWRLLRWYRLAQHAAHVCGGHVECIYALFSLEPKWRDCEVCMRPSSPLLPDRVLGARAVAVLNAAESAAFLPYNKVNVCCRTICPERSCEFTEL